MNMAEFRHDLDDRDDAEVRGLFEQHYTPITPSPDLVERLNQLVLREVQSVYHAEAVVAPAPAPRPSLLERMRRWLDGLGPGQSLAMAGAAAVAVILIFFGLSRVLPRPVSATAAVTGGEVTVLQARTGEFRTYQDGDFLKVVQGDRIIALNGMTTVTLFPGQTVIIEPDSYVELVQLDALADATQVEMFVRRGKTNNVIDVDLTEVDRYVVRSSSVNASVTGTQFSFETLASGESIVTTTSGAVTVSMDDQEVIVAQGEQVAAAPGATMVVEAASNRVERPTLLVIAPGSPGIPLYASPDVSARQIGFAPDNRLLSVLSEDESGSWYQICCVDGQAGWLQVDAIPPVTPEPTPESEPTAQEEAAVNAAVAEAAESPSPTEPATATATPSPTVTPLATATPSVTSTPSSTPSATSTATATRTETRHHG